MKSPESIEPLPRRVDFKEVLRVFDHEHSASGTHEWARKLLHQANEFYRGEWHLAEVAPHVVRNNITLMYHHHHPDGIQGQFLVPRTGATVAETSTRFKEIEQTYKESNAHCCAHIHDLKDAPFNPIFIASREVPFTIPDEHQTDLAQPKGNFLHLDGLHRMIAWDVAGRFEDEHYAESAKLLTYIAGPFQGFSK